MPLPKLKHRIRLRAELKFVIGLSAVSTLVVFLLIILFQTGPKQDAKGAPFTKTFTTGAYIIDMGVTPQTVNNGLKPYGLVYELIDKNDVPVNWVINPTKARDGIDFTYNSVSYKGGPFIIESEFIDSTIAALITTWEGMGVQGTFTTSDMTFPINYIRTINYFPNILVDDLSGNSSIIINYYNNAGIDSLAYDIGTPSDLTACHDLWVNPHGDPEWSTHGPLYNFATAQASYIWSECHAVSMLEGTENTSPPYEMLNYLTIDGLKCWKTNGKNPAATCGPSITETHSKNELAPFTYHYPTDPVMQFLGDFHDARDNGSEQWFRPQTTGGWRGTTKRLVTTATGTSPVEGVLMVYGYAYGNSNYGQVMYTGGHDFTATGSIQHQVAVQRSFFNFNLLAGKAKELLISSYSIPGSYYAGQTRAVSVTITSGYPPYSYQWSSTIGGTFADPTAGSTTFTAPATLTELDGVIKCVITDACGRKNVMVVPVNVFITALPVELIDFSAVPNTLGQVDLSWTTHSEKNNHYFTLSRSADGLRFEELDRIAGAGNTTTEHTYRYTDTTPNPGRNFYRLQQTDFNGNTETFTTLLVTIKVPLTADAGLIIAPNPFSRSFTVKFDAVTDMQTALKLVDLHGKAVYTRRVTATAGANRVAIRIPDRIPRGNYLIQLWSQGDLLATAQVIHAAE